MDYDSCESRGASYHMAVHPQETKNADVKCETAGINFIKSIKSTIMAHCRRTGKTRNKKG